VAGRAGRAVVAVLPQWLVARAVVLGSLALAHLVVDRTHPRAPGTVGRVHQGLLGWDAGWYEAIARHGYGALGHQALRFFPLFPLVGRWLATLPRLHAGVALVVLANASTLVATAGLRVLVLRESGDGAMAVRTVWLLSLAPPAFVLVMGYAEGTLLLFTVGCFLALRRGAGRGRWLGPRRPNWWLAAGCGAAAGLTRPLGVLLVLPAAVELARRWPQAAGGERALGAAAAAAPAAGAAVFFGWSWADFGHPFLPLTVQTQAGHHGGLSDPLRTIADDARGVLHHHFGTALHVPWVVVALVLLVVCWRRFPASYGTFATAVVVVALSGTNLDSFERYALSAFPLVMAGASLTAAPRVERTVLVLAAAGLMAYSLMAFLNLTVP
jgi:hypothetical protein